MRSGEGNTHVSVGLVAEGSPSRDSTSTEVGVGSEDTGINDIDGNALAGGGVVVVGSSGPGLVGDAGKTPRTSGRLAGEGIELNLSILLDVGNLESVSLYPREM